MRFSTPHLLSPDVHAVAVNGDLVFLNVGRDSYVCLPDGGEQAALTTDRRGLVVADAHLTAELVQAGLVEAAPATGPAPSEPWCCPAPAQSGLCDRYAVPGARDVMDLSTALIDLMRAYRGRPFREILAAAQRPRDAAPRLSDALIATVRDFHRWAPYAPTSAKCLLRAFMLLRLLRRRDLDAHWVFGVRTWPFHAHCWLQCEDMVLDDQPDRIRAFTPILVV